jgi:hypothetical protein
MLSEVCTNSALHETFNSNNGAYLWPKVPCKRYISVLIRFLDVTVTYPTTFFYRYRCLMYQVYKYVYIILIIIVARRKHLHSIVYLAAKLDRKGSYCRVNGNILKLTKMPDSLYELVEENANFVAQERTGTVRTHCLDIFETWCV